MLSSITICAYSLRIQTKELKSTTNHKPLTKVQRLCVSLYHVIHNKKTPCNSVLNFEKLRATNHKHKLKSNSVNLVSSSCPLWLKKIGLSIKYYVNYFPIQKLAKILPSNSSLVTSPVISPK